MNEIFAIGDVHGQLDILKILLTKWNPDSQLLVFLGDYIDRGHDSYGVIQLVHQLNLKYGAVTLGGNHELNFLEWLDDPEEYWFTKWKTDESIINYEEEAANSNSIWYYVNGGNKTIDSFFDGNYSYKYLPSKLSKYIKDNFEYELNFIRNLPDYFEWNDYVFVHAGVNLAYIDWKKSGQDDFRRIREPFHFMRNDTEKKFIFGHHPTRLLNKDESNKIWVSPCKTKIGIDGGAVFGGLLHCLIIKGNKLSSYSVNKNGEISFTEIKGV